MGGSREICMIPRTQPMTVPILIDMKLIRRLKPKPFKSSGVQIRIVFIIESWSVALCVAAAKALTLNNSKSHIK